MQIHGFGSVLLAFVLNIAWAAEPIQDPSLVIVVEISGQLVNAKDTQVPVSGAKVRWKFRSDSSQSDPQGFFKLNLQAIASNSQNLIHYQNLQKDDLRIVTPSPFRLHWILANPRGQFAKAAHRELPAGEHFLPLADFFGHSTHSPWIAKIFGPTGPVLVQSTGISYAIKAQRSSYTSVQSTYDTLLIEHPKYQAHKVPVNDLFKDLGVIPLVPIQPLSSSSLTLSSSSTQNSSSSSQAKITYQAQIEPMMRTYCTSCHGDRGGVDLSYYESVVEHSAIALSKMQSGAMPLNQTMPQDQIALFEKWMTEGMHRD
jgi:hypothetical protein